MNAQAGILRMVLAGGLVVGASGCGYIEDLIEDETTTSPADVSGIDSSEAASLAVLATKVSLVDGLSEGFGLGAEALGKGSGARLTVKTGSECPKVDVTGFDPNGTFPPTTLPADVTVVNTYVDALDAETCDDDATPPNDVTGMYTVTASSLDDETWPPTVDEFLAFDWAADNTYDTRYEFTDIMVTLDGPNVTATNLNGILDATTTGRDQDVVNVGNIDTVLTTPDGNFTARLNMVDITTVLADSTIPEPETTRGTFRITVTLLGFLDIDMTDIVVDRDTCPNHPVSGTATFTGADSESVTVDFGTPSGTPADCDQATVTSTTGVGPVVETINPIF